MGTIKLFYSCDWALAAYVALSLLLARICDFRIAYASAFYL